MLDLFQGARLTPTQRRIAHSLVQHAASAAYLSAAEVAELAGVSQPSVTRFAMALGYSGYPALRRELRALVDVSPVENTASNAMQRAVRAEADHLARLVDQLDDLDTGGTQLLDRLDQARAAGAGAMLTVVLPRYPRETLEAIRDAKAAGLKVVAITDSAVSPAAELAAVTLPAAVGTQLVFDLHTGPMAMAMVLLQAICDADPEPAQQRLEEFEAAAARRHIFEA